MKVRIRFLEKWKSVLNGNRGGHVRRWGLSARVLCSGAGAPKVEWGWGIDGAWGELSIPHTLGVGGVYRGGPRARVTHQSVRPRYDAQNGFCVLKV